MAAKPVIALPTIQHNFEAGESNRYKPNTNMVDLKLPAPPGLAPFLSEFNRIVNHATRQQQRQQPYRYIDEEHPPPGKVIGNPTTERRSDRGRRYDRHTIKREGGP